MGQPQGVVHPLAFPDEERTGFWTKADALTCSDLFEFDKLVTNTDAMRGIVNPHKSFGYLRTHEFIDVLVNLFQK